MKKDFIGYDSKGGALTVSGKYFWLTFLFIFVVLAFVFVSTNNLSERTGFAKGYVCANDNIRVERGEFIFSGVATTDYCDAFHEAFIKLKSKGGFE